MTTQTLEFITNAELQAASGGLGVSGAADIIDGVQTVGDMAGLTMKDETSKMVDSYAKGDIWAGMGHAFKATPVVNALSHLFGF